MHQCPQIVDEYCDCGFGYGSLIGYVYQIYERSQDPKATELAELGLIEVYGSIEKAKEKLGGKHDGKNG